MEYLECKVVVTPFTTGKDVLIARLAEIGFESFVEEEAAVLAYIPAPDFAPGLLDELVLSLSEYFSVSYTVMKIADKNWNEEWEKNYEPVIVDEKVRIRAPFHAPDPAYLYDIEIKPQMSFGTAHHDTTRQMLEVMSALEVKGVSLLDMGCGTGVIAILAALKGASVVTAIDNDEWAWENTRENMLRNRLSSPEVLLGDAALLEGRKFQVIMANINRNILLRDMYLYVNALYPKGQLWMSGFYDQDLDHISRKASSLGLTFLQSRSVNHWVVAGFILNHKEH
ncbi:MAG: 50S ribosomal protein L11 methyltransferase [Bacteroidia bacterium]|nr:50S ribosomal protein L11 methyltransferase [Bacteroidia bacterium]